MMMLNPQRRPCPATVNLLALDISRQTVECRGEEQECEEDEKTWILKSG